MDTEFSRIERQVLQAEAHGQATIEAYLDTFDGRLDALEDDEIEEQLASLKERLVEDGMLPEPELKSLGGNGSAVADGAENS